jgi:hypothetical protein
MTDLSTIRQLLSVDQLAARLGITVRHVRRLVGPKAPSVLQGRPAGRVRPGRD